MPIISSSSNGDSSVFLERLPFQYQPLSTTMHEIRLLRIPPKSSSAVQKDTINYKLFHTPLDDAAEYMALSYTWGPPTFNHLITIDDQSLHITESLAAALLNLQRDDKEVVIWIDQLCINQKDDLEKTEQVQLMRQIYKTAKQVIIWVGPSTPQTNCTMQEIRKLGSQLMQLGLWEVTNTDLVNWATEETDTSNTARIKRGVTVLMEQHFQEHLAGNVPFWWVMSDLGQRLWFKRIWCIQECTNGRVATFRCGQEEMDFTHYWATSLYVPLFQGFASSRLTGDTEQDWKTIALTNLLEACFSSVLAGVRRRYLVSEGHDLRTLLYMANIIDSTTTRIEATDPRDRVYALLGIANDSIVEDIKPDYTLSCEDSYIVAARALLKHGHDDVLSLCRARNMCQQLPSWVPDWSALIRKPWSTWHKERMFNASGAISQMGSPEGSFTNQQINLMGVIVDAIKEVGHVLSMGVDEKFNYHAARHLLDDVSEFLTRSEKYDPTQKQEAKWRIPVGDTQVSDLSCQVERVSHNSHMKAGHDIMRLVTNDEAKPEDIQQDRHSFACYMCQMERMYDCRPFISETGYVGLCPMNAQPGDTIVILSGARVPYVLRKHHEKDMWTLIGESHCYGIMDGEYTQQKPSLQTFTLS